MKRPSIGVVIATPGRRSLYRTLQSIAYQGLEPGDDVLVVGDGHHQPTADLVEAFGEPFHYAATQVTRTWGHDQLNYGVKKVKGDLLIYQDDDDIFAPRAFDEIRRIATRFPGVPFLGRVKTPNLGLLWQNAAPDALLDGHCLVVPNVKEKLGYFTREYAGDQAWIKTNLDAYEEVYWADRVWTLTRPIWTLYPHLVRPAIMLKYGFNLLLLQEKISTLLPAAKERELNGPNDWCWAFFVAGEPIALVKMYQDEERMMASLACVEGQEKHLGEIMEFIAWASQGLSVWLYLRPDDEVAISIAKSKGFESHFVTTKTAELIHDWPPKFFLAPEAPKPLIVDPSKEG